MYDRAAPIRSPRGIIARAPTVETRETRVEKQPAGSRHRTRVQRGPRGEVTRGDLRTGAEGDDKGKGRGSPQRRRERRGRGDGTGDTETQRGTDTTLTPALTRHPSPHPRRGGEALLAWAGDVCADAARTPTAQRAPAHPRSGAIAAARLSAATLAGGAARMATPSPLSRPRSP